MYNVFEGYPPICIYLFLDFLIFSLTLALICDKIGYNKITEIFKIIIKEVKRNDRSNS